MLTVSSIHIRRQDANLLDAMSYNVACYESEYGWVVWCDSVTAGFSREFRKLISFAKMNGCDWLRIDRDGEELEGFRKFDW